MSSPTPFHLGSHCSLTSCSTLDFLPLHCSHCYLLYCKLHSTPSSHDCPNDPSLNSSTRSLPLGETRTRDGPELKELLPDPKRGRIERREGGGEEKKSSKQELALEALKKRIDAKKAQSTTIGTKGGIGVEQDKEKKVNPIIRLMKLKQRAKSADPRKREGDVAMGERLYLTVKLVEGERMEDKGFKEVWIQKVSTIFTF